MSREIKFRAWDTKCGEWVLGLKLKLDGTIKDFDFDDEGYYEFEPEEGLVILEQYTGLKDKNGKEIYEGDIVKCYSQDTYPVGRVMYSEEWCAYEIVSYDPEDCRVYNLESFSPTVNKYLEVIGNIHENPELLRGEE